MLRLTLRYAIAVMLLLPFCHLAWGQEDPTDPNRKADTLVPIFFKVTPGSVGCGISVTYIGSNEIESVPIRTKITISVACRQGTSRTWAVRPKPGDEHYWHTHTPNRIAHFGTTESIRWETGLTPTNKTCIEGKFENDPESKWKDIACFAITDRNNESQMHVVHTPSCFDRLRAGQTWPYSSGFLTLNITLRAGRRDPEPWTPITITVTPQFEYERVSLAGLSTTAPFTAVYTPGDARKSWQAKFLNPRPTEGDHSNASRYTYHIKFESTDPRDYNTGDTPMIRTQAVCPPVPREPGVLPYMLMLPDDTVRVVSGQSAEFSAQIRGDLQHPDGTGTPSFEITQHPEGGASQLSITPVIIPVDGTTGIFTAGTAGAPAGVYKITGYLSRRGGKVKQDSVIVDIEAEPVPEEPTLSVSPSSVVLQVDPWGGAEASFELSIENPELLPEDASDISVSWTATSATSNQGEHPVIYTSSAGAATPITTAVLPVSDPVKPLFVGVARGAFALRTGDRHTFTFVPAEGNGISNTAEMTTTVSPTEEKCTQIKTPHTFRPIASVPNRMIRGQSETVTFLAKWDQDVFSQTGRGRGFYGYIPVVPKGQGVTFHPKGRSYVVGDERFVIGETGQGRNVSGGREIDMVFSVSENAVPGEYTFRASINCDEVGWEHTIQVIPAPIAGAEIVIVPDTLRLRPGTEGVFRISLAPAPDGDVRLDIENFNNSNVSRTPASLLFTEDTYNSPQEVSVSVASSQSPSATVWRARIRTPSGGGFHEAPTRFLYVIVENDCDVAVSSQGSGIVNFGGWDSSGLTTYLSVNMDPTSPDPDNPRMQSNPSGTQQWGSRRLGVIEMENTSCSSCEVSINGGYSSPRRSNLYLSRGGYVFIYSIQWAHRTGTSGVFSEIEAASKTLTGLSGGETHTFHIGGGFYNDRTLNDIRDGYPPLRTRKPITVFASCMP